MSEHLYFLWVNTENPGCDYSIACGQVLRALESDDPVKAAEEAKRTEEIATLEAEIREREDRLRRLRSS